MKKAFATALVLTGLTFTMIPASFSFSPFSANKMKLKWEFCNGGGQKIKCVKGTSICFGTACPIDMY